MLANATDIVKWADRLEARGNLPALVRRLAFASLAAIKRIGIRANEGIQLPDWDGIIEASTGSSFVPAGLSAWEMGVDGDCQRKANAEYKKRTADPRGIDPAVSSFVFVTPRRWTQKRSWIKKKLAEGVWRSVVVHDADDLATHLEEAPVTHLWISWLIGTLPPGAMSLESWWIDWGANTDPQYTPDLVLGGRKDAAMEVTSWLEKPASPLQLRASSQEEAIAFFAAAVMQLESDKRDSILSRSAVAVDATQWQHMSQNSNPLILLPTITGVNAMAAARRGHHILIPLGNDSPDSTGEITLPRANRRELEQILGGEQLTKDRATTLAALGRRSFGALRRELAVAPATMAPVWARPENARSLLPALLAGEWNDANTQDRMLLQQIADRPYEDFVADLSRWANESDPPVRLIGNTWTFLARQEGWMLLARALLKDDMDRIRAAILAAFQMPDTTYDLDPDRRWAATLFGHGHPVSGFLRQGFARGLALIAAQSTVVALPDAQRGQTIADNVVRTLLKDADWTRWASLSPWLPLFAEAAPQEFLSAVEVGVSGEEAPLIRLFAEEGKDAFFSRTPHTGLLWSLETLAWAPDYLKSVALLLAKMARNDPGGRLSNRPAQSLHQILLLWINNTGASIDQRIQAVDSIVRSERDVAWPLMLSLLPKLHESSSSTSRPTFRDWADASDESVTVAEYVHGVDEILKRILNALSQDPNRWISFLPHIGELFPEQSPRVLAALSAVDVQALSRELRRSIWNGVRDVISRHAAFPEADWSMSSGQLEALQVVYQKFQPVDFVDVYAWLFAQRPNLIMDGRADYELRERKLLEARTSAIIDLYKLGGVEEIYRFLSDLEEPATAGLVAGLVLQLSETEDLQLARSISEPLGSARRSFAIGFIQGRARLGGSQWALNKLASKDSWSLDPGIRAQLLLTLPLSQETWKLVERESNEIQREYWSYRNVWDDGTFTDDDHTYVTERRIEHGLLAAALDFIQLFERDGKARVPATLVAQLLEKMLADDSIKPETWHSMAYAIGSMLDVLEQSSEIPEARIASLEFQFLRLLDHTRQPRTLHRALARDPSLFVESLSISSAPWRNDASEISEQEQGRASLVGDLLRNWKTLPGRSDSGDIDADALNSWTDKVRAEALERDLLDLADEHIAGVLILTSREADVGWPDPVVCELVERLKSERVEKSMAIAIRNSRGVHGRDTEAGGDQERALASQFKNFANKIRGQYLRTALVLDAVADWYESDARQEDVRGELQQDREW